MWCEGASTWLSHKSKQKNTTEGNFVKNIKKIFFFFLNSVLEQEGANIYAQA